jgi:Fic family protein
MLLTMLLKVGEDFDPRHRSANPCKKRKAGAASVGGKFGTRTRWLESRYLRNGEIMANRWEPIQDLPQDWNALTDGELAPLLQFWNDQRSDLEKSGAMKQFSERLAREWSIETGQIEGVYNIDRGVTQTLIERGIDADLIPSAPGEKPPELVAEIIRDHFDVLEGLFQFVKGDRPLSKSYIHELHAALLRHQESTVAMDQFGNLFSVQLIKGKYKERPNNPKRADGTVHEYCPPEHVDSEMERLLAMHEQHKEMGVPIEVEAAWMHHRFTQIHPYQDGNGRVARALATLIFIKEGWFPVVVTRDDRTRYIDALEVTDEGNLRSLLSFFSDVEKRALFQATQAAADVQQVHTVDEAIAALGKVLAGPGKSLDPTIWITTRANADRLMELAEARLQKLVESLQVEVGAKTGLTFGITAMPVAFSPSDRLPYVPNTQDYARSRAIIINGERSVVIQIQAHAVGSKFRGLIGIQAVFQGAAPELASKEPFQVNYAEAYPNIERRFRVWLEESLVNSLTLWRRSL